MEEIIDRWDGEMVERRSDLGRSGESLAEVARAAFAGRAARGMIRIVDGRYRTERAVVVACTPRMDPGVATLQEYR
ncbi:hypothetical protein [Nonomuraea dietziae]|uniref:Uncharacterized protein n=1 Tax=Nonomuraea dietziae TaxID=65515 RepID=A0A7W5UV31_9ACTN|nr:hypothetical protein [Nonomuraea dietziae]MBB3725187.1 hypothetical protein [Nonomuraea dietziae]